MLGQNSEIRSRFVYELVIWTQPSGPLCLWQCLFENLESFCSKLNKIMNILKKSAPMFGILKGDIWNWLLNSISGYRKSANRRKLNPSTKFWQNEKVVNNDINYDRIQEVPLDPYGPAVSNEVTRKSIRLNLISLSYPGFYLHLTTQDKIIWITLPAPIKVTTLD